MRKPICPPPPPRQKSEFTEYQSAQLRVIEYIYATVCGSCISMNMRVELERIKQKIMEGKV